ncbi:hypothetical protein [Thorsellia kenyensis]|uniref:Uncharacterized protein n=1 Tax=Thorsellia kenyensis TaxID=1549888 RepID=A0ABV6CAH9_9GAMM
MKFDSGLVISGKTDKLGRTKMAYTPQEENIALTRPENPPLKKEQYYRASDNQQVERVMEFKE